MSKKLSRIDIVNLFILGKIDFEEYLMLMANGDEEVVKEFLKRKGIER